MRRITMALGAALLFLTATAAAEDRAEWGVAVTVGLDGSGLLLQNHRGFHLVVLDADAAIRDAGRRRMALGDIRPGDHIDYALVDWAGMSLAYDLAVTPRRLSAQAR